MELPCGTFNEDYKQDMAIFRRPIHWFWFLGFALLMGVLPLFAPAHVLTVIITVAVTIITVQGLNICLGYAGQINLGQAGFMAVGAYTSAILTSTYGVPFWIALPLAGVMAAAIGMIFGLPSLRIKGFYLVLATIAAQFIIIYIIMHVPSLTGGYAGMDAPAPRIGNLVLDTPKSYYYLAVPMAFIFTWFARNWIRTKMGRAFVAIRDNEFAAETQGVNIFRYKLLAFAASSFFAGIAGCLWGHFMGRVSPEHYTLMSSVWYLGIMIVGGFGSTVGVILGSVVYQGLQELVSAIAPAIASWFPGVAAGIFAGLGQLLFGVVIMLVLIFEPRGLNHAWVTLKTRFRLWPYSF